MDVTRHVPAVVEDLTVVAYTGISWSDPVGSVGLLSSGFAGATLQQVLSAEGDTASVVVYATFDDGTYEDVTSEASMISLQPDIVGVVVAEDEGAKGLVVEVGALKMCAPML